VSTDRRLHLHHKQRRQEIADRLYPVGARIGGGLVIALKSKPVPCGAAAGLLTQRKKSTNAIAKKVF